MIMIPLVSSHHPSCPYQDHHHHRHQNWHQNQSHFFFFGNICFFESVADELSSLSSFCWVVTSLCWVVVMVVVVMVMVDDDRLLPRRLRFFAHHLLRLV